MTLKTRRDLTLLLLLVLVDTLPFLNRAVHLDENTYLAIASNVSRNFWFPQDFPGQWFGIPTMNFGGHTHPVGLSYFIALTMELAHSQTEWCLRLGMVVFAVGYALGGYFLARRFTNHALATTLLMIVTPAVFVFSPTLMPDLPMTTLWMGAAVSFFAGIEGDRRWALLAAGVLLVLATWVSYQAVFMCVLLVFYACWRGKSRPFIFLILALPFVFLTVYWYAGYLHYGSLAPQSSLHYFTSVRLYSRAYFEQKALGMLTTLGATTVICAAVVWIFMWRAGWKKRAAILILSALTVLLVPKDYSRVELTEYFVFALAGVALLWMVAETFLGNWGKGGWREPPAASDVFIVLWCLGVVSYTVVLGEFSAARYVVSLVPPLIIVFVRWIERVCPGKDVFIARFLGVTIAMTWLLAVGVAYADYQFVGSYRDFAQQFFQKYDGSKNTVWVGTEAGLRYYMQQGGAHVLINPNGPILPGIMPGAAWGLERFGSPRPNDLLVRPASFLRYDIAPSLELSPVLETVTLTSPFPIRTWNPSAHAGLLGTNVGLLPFVFSRVPFDVITVSRFNDFAAFFDQAEKVSGPGESIHFVYFQVDHLRRGGIVLPPTAELTYELRVSPAAVVRAEWGLDDSITSPSACRSTISIAFGLPDTTSLTVCDQQIIDFNPTIAGRPVRHGVLSCRLNEGSAEAQDLHLQFKRTSGGSDACPDLGLWNLQWIGADTNVSSLLPMKQAP